MKFLVDITAFRASDGEALDFEMTIEAATPADAEREARERVAARVRVEDAAEDICINRTYSF